MPELRTPYGAALVHPAVFSARQCERIIAAAAAAPTEVGQVGGGDGASDHDDAIRRSTISWIAADEEHSWIHDKLAGVVRRANRRYGFDLIGFTEDLQFTRYDGAGAFYDWHQDGLDGELAVRKLSLVVQLSDPADYEGGDLELFALDGGGVAVDPERREQMRRRGSVTVFPSFEYHRVTPLHAGTRCSLVCWVGGPPFR